MENEKFEENLKPEDNNQVEEEKQEENKKTNWQKIISIALNVVLVISITFFVIRLSMLILLTNIYVTGPSMYPSLKPGQAGYTRKIYDHDCIERFDVVVINAERFAPKDSHWVKRVIGLPGETISYKIDETSKTGTLYINGKAVKENFLKGYDDLTPQDITYATREIKERLLGDDEYFVMGDNRGHSTDSRSLVVGHIKEKEIIGVGIVIIGTCNDFTGKTCESVNYGKINFVGW